MPNKKMIKSTTRLCKDCHITFPYIPRRTLCIDCYKKYTNFTKRNEEVQFIDDD